MHATLQTLLSHVIDYAGSFPPANLSLEETVRNFGRYLQEPDAWMLGRLVCPASKLVEIAPQVQEVTLPDRTISFSVLGRGGADGPSFFRNIEADLADMQAFAGICPGLVALECYETRLPGSFFHPIKDNQINAGVATLAFLFEKAGMALQPFVEPPQADGSSVQALLAALHADHSSPEANRRQIVKPVGLKLRTGGLDSAAFPSTELVAATLVGCRKTFVPFKATAGLHHPIRQHRAEVNTRMHGFLNVFLAGCLSHAYDLPVAEIQACLDDEIPGNFRLEGDDVAWRKHRLTGEQIAAGRQVFTSFGSCSFDDPRDDLRAMGWLG